MVAIVNTDPTYWIVGRLRFREAKRSVEVLDIDIALSPRDVWVGEISRLATGGAVLNSPDYYIIPPFGDVYVSTIAGSGMSPFTMGSFPPSGYPFIYAPQINDELTLGAAQARTEYGSLEFIGEENVCQILYAPCAGSLVGKLARTDSWQEECCDPLKVPGNRNVDNVLEGTVYILRPDIAISHQYNMTSIANFSIDIWGIYQTPGTFLPNLLYDVQGGIDYYGTLNPGAPSPIGFYNLEALLSKRYIDYQYVDQGTYAGVEVYDPADLGKTPTSTSVVVTFPTKHFHYLHSSPFAYNPLYPFLLPFTGLRETLGDENRPTILATPAVGEFVQCSIWDRTERSLAAPAVSPVLGCRLPYETNVIGLYPVDPNPPATVTVPYFRNNMTIGTANASTVPVTTFYSGWGRIDLSPSVGPPLLAGDTRTYRQGAGGILFNFFNNYFSSYRGLPAIGIVMTEFYNGLPTVNGYYGNTVPWQYIVEWLP
jgi:hypothetical protein